mmetsp:Transcript_20164/g.52859  ORF Transcript_20164/g.52859 Transcript_20164/m.52859 type:complete len:234 (+) Transcript_20164:104-805(+)
MGGPVLDYYHPTPLFLGMYPITLGAQVICSIHAVVCIFCVATASSAVTFKLGLYEVPPELQVAVSAWHLVGIAVIAGAFVGLSRYDSAPITVYFYYLVVSTLAWGFLCFKLMDAGAQCKFVQDNMESQRVGLSFACAMVSAAWISAMFLALAVAAYANYTIYQLREFLLQSDEAGYLLDREDGVAKGLREGRDLGIPRRAARAEREPPIAYASPAQGPQPGWGSVAIRSTAMP